MASALFYRYIMNKILFEKYQHTCLTLLFNFQFDEIDGAAATENHSNELVEPP